MTYRILADLVLIAHALFVAFVILGGLLALWKPWVAWLHLPALVWGALVVGMGWICPLTPLEASLRIRAGQEGYAGGFIEHYIVGIIYPAGITRTTQLVLAALLIVGNIVVYALWARRRSRGKTKAASTRP